MSSPQASDAMSPNAGGQLEDAVSTFSDAVFEATQGLLKAQQELTQTVLSGRAGQRAEHEQEPVPVTTETGGQEHGDDRDEATSDLGGVADQGGEADELDDEADGADEVEDEADEADELDDAGEVDGKVPGETAPDDELAEDDEGAINNDEEPYEAEGEYAEEGEEDAADDLDEGDQDEADQDEADQPVPARSGRRR